MFDIYRVLSEVRDTQRKLSKQYIDIRCKCGASMTI